MTHTQSNSLEQDQSRSQVEADLLEAILQVDALYPWYPADPASEDFFTAIEAEFSLDDWSEAEIMERSNDFFAQLEQCWLALSPSPVQQSLLEQFGALVPSQWLEAIAQRAQELVSVGLSPLDRLVECVKPLLTEWGEEDLQVFARPLVYAMRSAPSPEREVKSWENLGEVEKARYLMKIAKVALEEVENSSPSD